MSDQLPPQQPTTTSKAKAPFTTPEDREAVRVLAISVGVREAARQLGLNQSTVKAWSLRDKWFAPAPVPPHKRKLIEGASNAPKAGDVLLNMLSEDSLQTKVGFSKAARKVASHLAEKSPNQLINKNIAIASKQWSDVAGKVHGWDQAGEKQSSLAINVLAGGRAIVQIAEAKPT